MAPVYRELYIAAFLFGLAMGVHHVTVLFFLPSLAALVLATAKPRFFISRNLLFAALIAIVGLSIYAYLPLAASRSPLINWGEPRTMDAVWQHMLGKQYQMLFRFDTARLADHLWFLVREWGAFGLPAVLALAIAGLIDRSRRDRAVVAFLLVATGIDILYISLYFIADDRDAYYLPTFISLTIAVACGVRWIIEKGGTDLLRV
jgi:hypothetical protein